MKILAGLLLAFIAGPMSRFCQQHLKLPRRGAIVAVYCCFLAILVGFISFVTPGVIRETRSLIMDLPQIEEKIISLKSEKMANYPAVNNALTGYLRSIVPDEAIEARPIALIEENLPVVVVMPSPKGRAVLHSKLVSNISEIQARGARTIVIAEEGDETVRPFADHLIEIPAVPTLLQPLISTVPLQVLAAEIARSRGYDVDKPRNLAKSVTVE